MPGLRLDKIIAGTGLYSRSEAAALIKRGRVTADGAPALSPAEKYDPDQILIAVDGDPVKHNKYRYIMLNKPCGYVSSTADKRDSTVMELLDKKYSKLGLFPAGRLDKDAEGLLLLTNDGEFAHRVTSPAKGVRKRYFAGFEGAITSEDIEAFALGLTLGDGTVCLPSLIEPAAGGAYITLSEGKYHQVKRMMASRGKRVTSLRRVAIGGLILDENLEPGSYRELEQEAFCVFDD